MSDEYNETGWHSVSFTTAITNPPEDEIIHQELFENPYFIQQSEESSNYLELYSNSGRDAREWWMPEEDNSKSSDKVDYEELRKQLENDWDSTDGIDKITTGVKLGDLLGLHFGEFAIAEEFLKKTLRLCVPGSSEACTVMNSIAGVNFFKGDFANAKSICESILYTFQEPVISAENMWKTVLYLSKSYHWINQYQKVVKLLEKFPRRLASLDQESSNFVKGLVALTDSLTFELIENHEKNEKALLLATRDLPEEFPASVFRAICLKSLGTVYFEMKNTEKSEEYYLRAHSFFSVDYPRVFQSGINYYDLGMLYANLNSLTKAEEYYLKAASVFQHCCSSPLEITNLSSLGFLYRKQNRYEEALSTILSVGDLLRAKYPQSKTVGTNLINLGELWLENGNFSESKSVLLESLSFFNKHYPDSIERATVSYSLAKLFHRMNQLDNQETSLVEAYLRFRQLDPALLETAEVLSALGNLYFEQNRTKEAKLALMRAQLLFSEHHPNTLSACVNLFDIGAYFQKMGETIEALFYYKEAKLKLQSCHPKSIYIAKAMSNMGLIFLETAKLEEAQEMLQVAEALCVNFYPNSEVAQLTAFNLGRLLLKQGNFEEALVKCEFARRMLAQMSRFSDIAVINLRTTAEIYLRLNRPEDAISTFSEALDILRNHHQMADERTELLDAYGDLLEKVGRLEDAEKAYVEARVIYDNINCQSLSSAKNLSSLGNVLKRLGRLSEAKTVCTRALLIFTIHFPDSPEIVQNLSLLTLLLEHTRRYEESEPVHIHNLCLTRSYMIEDTSNSLEKLRARYWKIELDLDCEPVQSEPPDAVPIEIDTETPKDDLILLEQHSEIIATDSEIDSEFQPSDTTYIEIRENLEMIWGMRHSGELSKTDIVSVGVELGRLLGLHFADFEAGEAVLQESLSFCDPTSEEAHSIHNCIISFYYFSKDLARTQSKCLATIIHFADSRSSSEEFLVTDYFLIQTYWRLGEKNSASGMISRWAYFPLAKCRKVTALIQGLLLIIEAKQLSMLNSLPEVIEEKFIAAAAVIPDEFQTAIYRAECFAQLGVHYYSAGMQEKAKEYLFAAHSICLRHYPRLFYTAIILYNIGVMHGSIKKLIDAMHSYQQAERIFAYYKMNLDAACNMNNLSVIYKLLGKHEKALEKAKEARDFLSANHPTSITAAQNLFNLGDQMMTVEAFTEAEDIFQQCYSIYTRYFPTEIGCGNVAVKLAKLYEQRGQLRDAEKYMVEAHMRFKKINASSKEVADSANSIGELLMSQRNFGEVKKWLLSARFCYSQYHQKSIDEYINLSNLGDFCEMQGEREEALRYYSQAKTELMKKYSYSTHAPRTLLGIAKIMITFGKPEEAIKNLENAESICAECHSNTKIAAETCYLLGKLFAIEGKLQKAKEKHSKARKIFASLHADSIEVAHNLYALAEISESEESVLLYQEACSILRDRYPDAECRPKCLDQMGVAFSRAGRPDEAFQSFIEAREIYDTIVPASDASVMNLINLARAFHMLGMISDAAKITLRAQFYYQENRSDQLEAISNASLLEQCYAELKKFNRSEEVIVWGWGESLSSQMREDRLNLEKLREIYRYKERVSSEEDS